MEAEKRPSVGLKVFENQIHLLPLQRATPTERRECKAVRKRQMLSRVA